ncbi:hypothetical protein BGX27_009828 [Mortierella sp. AM989]|nr:hypothetical protein BGX27_009828 [Mortierella sp. AM989]
MSPENLPLKNLNDHGFNTFSRTDIDTLYDLILEQEFPPALMSQQEHYWQPSSLLSFGDIEGNTMIPGTTIDTQSIIPNLEPFSSSFGIIDQLQLQPSLTPHPQLPFNVQEPVLQHETNYPFLGFETFSIIPTQQEQQNVQEQPSIQAQEMILSHQFPQRREQLQSTVTLPNFQPTVAFPVPQSFVTLPVVDAPRQHNLSETRLTDPQHASVIIRVVDTEEELEKINENGKRKRIRNSLTLDKKLKIIKYRESNPLESYPDLSKRFGVPRSTLYGIINERNSIQAFVENKPHVGLSHTNSRMTTSRFRILEELLGVWHDDLTSRGIPVSDKKIAVQAFDIHRMFSSLLQSQLPPCQFTSGWCKGFKKRKCIGQASNPYKASTMDQEGELEALQEQLQKFTSDDIYFWDTTSMFLNIVPTKDHSDHIQNDAIHRMDSFSASMMLIYNASSTDMRPPHVFVRECEGILDVESDRRLNQEANLDRLLGAPFRASLDEFGANLDREVLVLVDEAIWEYLRTDTETMHKLRFVSIMRVPRAAASSLATCGIIKEFKIKYHILLLELWANRTHGGNFSKKELLDIYIECAEHAWSLVENTTINNRYVELVSLCGQLQKSIPGITRYKSHDNSETDLRHSLESMFPSLSEATLELYSMHDKDTGPSNRMRRHILQMQKNQDFAKCFGQPSAKGSSTQHMGASTKSGDSFRGTTGLARWIMGHDSLDSATAILNDYYLLAYRVEELDARKITLKHEAEQYQELIDEIIAQAEEGAIRDGIIDAQERGIPRPMEELLKQRNAFSDRIIAFEEKDKDLANKIVEAKIRASELNNRSEAERETIEDFRSRGYEQEASEIESGWEEDMHRDYRCIAEKGEDIFHEMEKLVNDFQRLVSDMETRALKNK